MFIFSTGLEVQTPVCMICRKPSHLFLGKDVLWFMLFMMILKTISPSYDKERRQVVNYHLHDSVMLFLKLEKFDSLIESVFSIYINLCCIIFT